MGARGWSSARLGLVVCGYFALFCGEIFPQAEAGCRERESPNCCTGRNNECFEYTKRKTVCYCDTYCQKTGDCCEDYKRVCQISGELLVPSPIWHQLTSEIVYFFSSKFRITQTDVSKPCCMLIQRSAQWRLLFIVVQFEPEMADSEVTRRQWDILHIAVSSAPIKAVCLKWPDRGAHW